MIMSKIPLGIGIKSMSKDRLFMVTLSSKVGRIQPDVTQTKPCHVDKNIRLSVTYTLG